MKKTLSANVGGNVYQMDEDAYSLLDNYLENLRYRFRQKANADAIVHDIETRMAAPFDGLLQEGRKVITIEDVDTVIAQTRIPDEKEGEVPPVCREDDRHDTRMRKRLFRDPDDRILGGVVSGLSAYLGCDPTWMRLLLVCITFFWWQVGFLYLIGWVIIPLATTATEKLQMRGGTANVGNAAQAVTGHAQQETRPAAIYSLLHRAGDLLVRLIGFLLKALLAIMAICCIPAFVAGMFLLFALLASATGIIASIPTVFSQALPWVNWHALFTSMPGLCIALAICGCFVVGIPLAALIQLLMQGLGKWRPLSTGMKIVFTLIWISALAASALLVLQLPLLARPHIYL